MRNTLWLFIGLLALSLWGCGNQPKDTASTNQEKKVKSDTTEQKQTPPEVQQPEIPLEPMTKEDFIGLWLPHDKNAKSGGMQLHKNGLGFRLNPEAQKIAWKVEGNELFMGNEANQKPFTIAAYDGALLVLQQANGADTLERYNIENLYGRWLGIWVNQKDTLTIWPKRRQYSIWRNQNSQPEIAKLKDGELQIGKGEQAQMGKYYLNPKKLPCLNIDESTLCRPENF